MKINRICLLAGSILALLSPSKQALAGPAGYQWSGFYVGVQAGYGAGRSKLTVPGAGGTTTEACSTNGFGIVPLYDAPAGSVFDTPETGNQSYPALIAGLLGLADNGAGLYIPGNQGAFDFRGTGAPVAADECIYHSAYALGPNGAYFGGREGAPLFPLPAGFPADFTPSDGNGTIVTTTTPGAGDAYASVHTKGFIGGVQAGYNHVMENGLLIGAEGDLSLSGMDGSEALGAGSLSSDVDWFGSARVRIGAVRDAWLFYATAGGAVSGTTVSYSTGGATGSDSDIKFGWTAGAGVEYGLTEKVSVKGEYKYFDFGDGSYSINGTTIRGSSRFSTFTIGLNFHL